MFARFKKSAQMFRDVRTLAVAGILIALNVVLGLFRIQITQELRLSIGFVATAALAMLLGPVSAVPAAAIADVLALLLHPSGAYFFGFTVTAMVEALIYSLLLFDRPAPLHGGLREKGHGNSFFVRGDVRLLLRALSAKTLVNLICNVGLNTLWLSMLYGSSMQVLLPARAVKNLAMLIPETLVMFFALKAANIAWRQIKR